MSEEIKHSPTPWWFDNDTTTIPDTIVSNSGKRIAEFCGECSNAEDEANAAHVVKCVNAHDDLLAACVEFVRKVDAGEARSTRSYQQMKAAIAKANQ